MMLKQRNVCVCSLMSDSATSCTVGHQALLSMGFSKQEYWSGFSCPPPRDLPEPGMNPHLLSLLALHTGSFPLVTPRKPQVVYISFNAFQMLAYGVSEY